MSELKPCPFCGGRADFISGTLRESGFKFYRVFCSNCQSRTYMHNYVSDAADLWNTRTSGWQPIEAAPKDGTWILAINATTNKGRQHVVHYSERHSPKFAWVTGSAPMDFVAGITHWQPLPEPPNEQS